MIFYCIKFDCTTFIKVGFSLLYFSVFSYSIYIFLTNIRHPFDVEPSYLPIFMLIQSVVHPVGMYKHCSDFIQKIDYNSKDIAQILTKICTNNHPRMSYNSAGLEYDFVNWSDFFKCAKR